MEFKKIGKSDIEVSQLGFGCMSLEGDQNSVSSLIRSAVDHGISLFDTADMYDHGRNEEMLGKALQGIRNEVVIATKVGHVRTESGYTWDPSYERVIQGCENSLKRLQTDHIDIYQLHGGTIEDPIDDLIRAMQELRDAGKIKTWGISSIRPNVIREYTDRSDMDSVMMQYSLLDRRPQESALKLLKSNNIGVLARGGIAKGLLAGKAAKPYLKYNETQVKEIQQSLKAYGDPLSLSLSFIKEEPSISSAVIGIRTQEQLDEVVSAWNTDVDPELIQTIKRSIPTHTYDKHR